MKLDTDLVVIGAGVIGLAVSYKFASKGYSVFLLEKEKQFGTGVSSRSSEVIHAGVYYRTGSLKASLCLKGKDLLYYHCEKYNINHKKIGKLFIAVEENEITSLEKLKLQAENNGLMDLKYLNKSEIKKIEPSLNSCCALYSPSTGIIDSHGLMKSLFQLNENHDVTYASLSPVLNAEPIINGWKVMIGGIEPTSITTRMVINSAGLSAINISNIICVHVMNPALHFAHLKYNLYLHAFFC